MTAARLKAIKSRMASWRQIADENDPMNSMLDVMKELVSALEKKPYVDEPAKRLPQVRRRGLDGPPPSMPRPRGVDAASRRRTVR